MIYVVDDEQNIRDLVKSYLQKEGYDVEVFADGENAYKCFKNRPADMLILDIMMPGMDGYSLCREIRKSSEVPIIMISAKDDEIDKVLGLELGSDDYISKPFSPRELAARVKTIFRRVREDKTDAVLPGSKELRCRNLTILPDERRISVDNKEIEFTAKEYDFIYYMVKNKNRVFTREQMINSIWGYDFIGDERTIDDLVKRVRRKLEDAGSDCGIITVRGYGYKVVD